MLEAWVAEEAGGLVVIAGPVHTAAWVQSPEHSAIRSLYPVEFQKRLTLLDDGLYGSSTPWPLDFSRDGEESAFLWLGDTASESRLVWSEFDGVYGCYAVKGPKPGARVLDVWYDRSADGAEFGLAIHRASLFDALLEAALRSGVTLTAGHPVRAAESGRLYFDDRPCTPQFDLVIDATGARSVLSPLTARPLPYGAIWGTVAWPDDAPLPQNHLSQSYRRADRMMGVLPCGTLPGSDIQQTAIFWSLPRNAHAAWRAAPLEDWKAEATALWPDFAPFIDQITTHEQMTMARYSHGTLRSPIAEKLAMIGDSAHRASPQLGQGANMALLDAMALARAMAEERDLDTALLNYARARRAHIWAYQAMSWAFTPQYQSDSRWLPVLRDKLLFPLSQIPPVPALLTRLVCGNMLPPLGSLTPR